jgi:hypothetical protein
VHIALRSYDQAALTRALDGLTNLAGLKPRPLDPQLQGEARHYYLSDKATEAWYVNALELIRGFVDTSFWGNVTCEGDASTQRGFGNPSEWWTELREGLAKDDVITSFVSYSGYRRRLFFDLDHLRQVLSLDIQSFGGDDVAETHQRFATELGLKPAPPDRYRYRKWGQLFDIRWESPEALADAIDAALGTLFKGGRVALPEATLHMGDGEEEVQAFSTLPAFLKYLREEAKNLTEVHLVAEGPRGEAIGVHVDKQLTRMMLHASTASFKAFTAFKKTLKGGLAEMKPKPSDSLQESAAAPESGESPKPSGWVVSIALGLFALAGALLGTEFYKAIRESAKLVILLPPGKNGEFETTSKNVLVRWTYNTPHALGRETQDALHRTWVEASRIPDGTPVIPREQHSGSVQLTNLAPGSYCVLLIAEDATASLIVNVLPAAPQQPATNKPGSK